MSLQSFVLWRWRAAILLLANLHLSGSQLCKCTRDQSFTKGIPPPCGANIRSTIINRVSTSSIVSIEPPLERVMRAGECLQHPYQDVLCVYSSKTCAGGAADPKCRGTCVAAPRVEPLPTNTSSRLPCRCKMIVRRNLLESTWSLGWPAWCDPRGQMATSNCGGATFCAQGANGSVNQSLTFPTADQVLTSLPPILPCTVNGSGGVNGTATLSCSRAVANSGTTTAAPTPASPASAVCLPALSGLLSAAPAGETVALVLLALLALCCASCCPGVVWVTLRERLELEQQRPDRVTLAPQGCKGYGLAVLEFVSVVISGLQLTQAVATTVYLPLALNGADAVQALAALRLLGALPDTGVDGVLPLLQLKAWLAVLVDWLPLDLGWQTRVIGAVCIVLILALWLAPLVHWESASDSLPVVAWAFLGGVATLPVLTALASAVDCVRRYTGAALRLEASLPQLCYTGGHIAWVLLAVTFGALALALALFSIFLKHDATDALPCSDTAEAWVHPHVQIAELLLKVCVAFGYAWFGRHAVVTAVLSLLLVTSVQALQVRNLLYRWLSNWGALSFLRLLVYNHLLALNVASLATSAAKNAAVMFPVFGAMWAVGLVPLLVLYSLHIGMWGTLDKGGGGGSGSPTSKVRQALEIAGTSL